MMAHVELRRRWRGVIAIGLLLGLAGAFALTAAIGSKRAATSWDRFATATDSPDALVMAPSLTAGTEVLAVAKATPGVRAATGYHWLPIQPGDVTVDLMSFVFIDDSAGRTIYRPRLIAGRLAEQTRAEEANINRALASLGDLHVGDHVPAVALGLDFDPQPGVVDQELVVVGIVEGTLDLGPNAGLATLFLTAAFRDRWLDSVLASWGTDVTEANVLTPIMISVEQRADAGAVANTIVAASPPGTTAAVGTLAPSVETTIGYATGALAILAAVAALATLVIAAQAIGRLVQPVAGEEKTWASLGTTPRERTAALAAAPLAAAGVAVVVAAIGGVLATPLVPTGFARRIEIDRGIWVDSVILVVALAILGVTLGAMAISFAARAQRRTGDQTLGPTPSWLGVAAAALGVRAALGLGTTAAARRRARSAIAATLVGIAGIGAVALVASSSDATLDSPRSWGFGFDRFVGLSDSFVDDPSAAEAALDANPAVGGLSLVDIGTGTLSGSPIELQQIEPRRGSALPVLLDGRAPLAADEVVLGPLALREHGLDLGDSTTLIDDSPAVRIVGTAAIPAQQDGDFGYVAWFGPGAFARLGIEGDRYAYMTAAPGVPVNQLDEIDGASPPFKPANLKNLHQIGAIPYLLAGFLGLLALASLAHALLVAVHGRRRDLAVLRSLGFVGRQVRRTVAWQATTTTIVGVVSGVPIGLLAGTWVWRRMAASLGTPPDVSVPYVVLALVAVGAMLAAYAVALGPARRAGQIRPADALRDE